MRIGRAIIIPAVLALSVAGSALIGITASAGAASAPAVHAHTGPATGVVYTFYHG